MRALLIVELEVAVQSCFQVRDVRIVHQVDVLILDRAFMASLLCRDPPRSAPRRLAPSRKVSLMLIPRQSGEQPFGSLSVRLGLAICDGEQDGAKSQHYGDNRGADSGQSYRAFVVVFPSQPSVSQ